VARTPALPDVCQIFEIPRREIPTDRHLRAWLGPNLYEILGAGSIRMSMSNHLGG
jgi:hypothetical protein